MSRVVFSKNNVIMFAENLIMFYYIDHIIHDLSVINMFIFLAIHIFNMV